MALYNYLQVGNQEGFSYFEDSLFQLIKWPKTNSDLNTLYPLVDNTEQFPLSFAENFIEWKASIKLDNIIQTWILRKGSQNQKTIGLLPVGPFESTFDIEAMLDVIRKWLSCVYMGFKVFILPVVDYVTLDVTSRHHSRTAKLQILSSSLCRKALEYCENKGFRFECLAVMSWNDLYPSDSLNFELGQGNPQERCAVLCFGRFEPQSFSEDQPDVKLDGRMVWQMMKVTAHEIAHVFAFKHCIEFKCLMNGSKSIKQAMNQPLIFCPSCLRKLKELTGCNLDHWFAALSIVISQILAQFPDCTKLVETSHWIKRVIEVCNNPSSQTGQLEQKNVDDDDTRGGSTDTAS